MDKLGIEPSVLLAQIVNFAIIMVVLTKLLYKPILHVIQERKKKIEEGLELTQKLEVEEKKTEEKRQKVLMTAKKEGQVLIEEARKRGKEEEKEIIEEARRSADEILEKAKVEALEQRKMMEKSIRDETIDLAGILTQKMLSNIMTKNLQKKVVSEAVSGIRKIRN